MVYGTLFSTSLRLGCSQEFDPGPVCPFLAVPNLISHVQTTTLLPLLVPFLLNPLPHQRLLRLFQPQSESRLPRTHASPFPALLTGCGAFAHSLARGADISAPRVGTTIKTGDAGQGEEGDLYAVASVVNVNVHLQGNGDVRAVVEYVLGKAAEGTVRGEGAVGLCEELKRLLTIKQG